MATPLCYPINRLGNNTTPSGKTIAVAGSAVETYAVNPNNLVRIVSDQPVNIRFGPDGLTTATADDVYFPADFVEIHDMGTTMSTIAVFNPGTTSANVNVSIISRT